VIVGCGGRGKGVKEGRRGEIGQELMLVRK
jgi:hypothetical protein